MSLLWGKACIMTDLASLVLAEEDGEGDGRTHFMRHRGGFQGMPHPGEALQ